MTIEEQKTLVAIQAINRKTKDQTEPDWEERRFTTAVAAMQAIIINSREFHVTSDFENEAALQAISFADKLIEKLRT